MESVFDSSSLSVLLAAFLNSTDTVVAPVGFLSALDTGPFFAACIITTHEPDLHAPAGRALTDSLGAPPPPIAKAAAGLAASSRDAPHSATIFAAATATDILDSCFVFFAAPGPYTVP